VKEMGIKMWRTGCSRKENTSRRERK